MFPLLGEALLTSPIRAILPACLNLLNKSTVYERAVRTEMRGCDVLLQYI